jgi:DNA polymerase III subunit gamma/tau
MRDAISLLDQLSSTGERITLALAQSVLGTATNQVVIELVDAIQTRQAGQGMDCIRRALDSGSDPRQFARQVVEYLRSLLLVKLGNAAQVDATPEMRVQIARHAEGFTLAALIEAIRLFNTAATDTRGGWQPSLMLELALAEAIEAPEGQIAQVYVPVPAPAPVPIPTPSPAQPVEPPRQVTPVPPAQGPTPSPVQTPSQPPAQQKTPAQPATQAKPPAPHSAQPQAAPPKPGSTPSLNDITQNWSRIRTVVKKKRSQTEALLNSCKPLAIKDGVLILGFQTEVLKEKMETGDNLAITRAAIAQLLGADMAVRAIVMTAKGGQLPNDLDVDGEGMVGTALNLGAEIVHKE